MALKLPPIFAEAGITSRKFTTGASRRLRGQVFFGASLVFAADPVIHRVGAGRLLGTCGDTKRRVERCDPPRFSDIRSWVVRARCFSALLPICWPSRCPSCLARSGELASSRANFNIGLSLKRNSGRRSRVMADSSRSRPDAMLVSFNKKIVYANNAAPVFLARLRQRSARPLTVRIRRP